MTFAEMKLDNRLLKALQEMKFDVPTEIQTKIIPLALAGKDVIGQSMTGSGKTAAFALPILQATESGKGIQCLIVTPTRDLTRQIAEHFGKFSKHKRMNVATVYGGVGIEPQIMELRRADIVVGTPGRILDHMRRGTIDFRNLKVLVLDEADRMLDMGFIDDVREIIMHLPKRRQTMLFSATIPDEVRHIANRYMHEPVKVTAEHYVPKSKLSHYYYDVRQEDKLSLLVHLINKENPSLAMVFCSTRRMADVVARVLYNNKVEAKAIHGGLTQNQREQILAGFHEGRPHVLVATDVAARGLDIKDVSHVFNYDVPKDADDYTHRTGRTARIGKEGKAISLLSQHDHEAFRRIIKVHEIQKVHAPEYPRIRMPVIHHSRDDHHRSRMGNRPRRSPGRRRW